MTILKADDARASCIGLDTLATQPRWVAWQSEKVGDRITKIPYSPRTNGKARSNDSSTWGTMLEALAKYDQLPNPLAQGGVGLQLGNIGGGWSLGGIDLDSCIGADGVIEPWAREIISRFRSYAEVSPSGTGAKVFFLYDTDALSALRSSMGNSWSKLFKRGGGEHPPAIEVHFGNRYFTLTGNVLPDVTDEITLVPSSNLHWIIEQVGQAFAHTGKVPALGVQRNIAACTSEFDSVIADLAITWPLLQKYWSGDFLGLADQSRSGKAMALGGALKRAGVSFDEMCALLSIHPATSDWAREKGEPQNQRELQRIWDKVVVTDDVAGTQPGEPSRNILQRTIQPCPSLPLAPFGPFWGEWIKQAAEGANAAVDYTAIPLLALTSALIGNARWVKAWDGWSEPPVLWCCALGDPSSGKTPGAAPVIREVLGKIEAWMAKDFPAVHAEWLERSTAAIARKKVWENSVTEAVENGTEPPPRPQGIDLEDEPKPPCARVGNTTIEQMVNILARQPKGLLCANDELAQWFLNFQRYSSGSDRPFWLESYTGGVFRLDRVSKAEPVRIPQLSVALFGTVQPDRLAQILKHADDGLVSRFLFTWPEPIPFKRPKVYANIQTAADALARVSDLAMSVAEDGNPVPSFIPLSDEAADLFESFAKELAERERHVHGLMKGAVGKSRGQTLRMALILEFLWWCGGGNAEPPVVSRRSMTASITLMETYFLPMAMRAFEDAAVPEVEKHARLVARWIVDLRPSVVNVTEIRDRAHLGGLRETKDVKAAVQYLVEANWLLAVPHVGAGRPRGDYIVNPKVWDMLGTSKD